MAVRYNTTISFYSNGTEYKARSMLGRHAQEAIKRSTKIERLLAKDDDEADEEAGIETVAMAAYVTSCCLLDDDGERLAFDAGAVEVVLEMAPQHLIMACFEACMRDAGLENKQVAGSGDGKPEVRVVASGN